MPCPVSAGSGGVEVKGKGRMDTYIWYPEDELGCAIPPAVGDKAAFAKVGSGSITVRARHTPFERVLPLPETRCRQIVLYSSTCVGNKLTDPEHVCCARQLFLCRAQ